MQIKAVFSLIADRMNMNTKDIKTIVLGENKKVNNNL
jgi:hypothetical protein